MLRHDFHLHTRFSADSMAEPRAYCVRALEHRYRAVCFTDHADFERSDMGYGFYDHERYYRAVLDCREEFSDRLAVGFGVEIDYHHSWEDEIRSFLAGKSYDYVLGAVHYLDDHVLVMEEEHFTGKDQRRAYGEYFAEVLRLVESGICQGLAHLDVIKRTGAKLYGPYRAVMYADHLVPVFSGLAARGMALEINLSGYRQGLGEPLPAFDVLELYATAGGRLVTVGSDAHRPEDACPDLPEVWNLIERKGFVLWEPAPGFWGR
ncbi:MAG: histidinol-phosphatase HisJ family protein [Patescibacteria group bacterium]